MHEMGIAGSILDAVQKELLRYPGYYPVKIDVRVGEYAGIDPESLQFCFGAIVKDTRFSSLELALQPCGGDELDLGNLELEEVVS